jgi:hypothetical protein
MVIQFTWTLIYLVAIESIRSTTGILTLCVLATISFLCFIFSLNRFAVAAEIIYPYWKKYKKKKDDESGLERATGVPPTPGTGAENIQPPSETSTKVTVSSTKPLTGDNNQ